MAGMHLDHVKKKNMKVLFFVDNAKKLIRRKILGKKVYNPKIIKTSNFDNIIVSGDTLTKFLNSLKN